MGEEKKIVMKLRTSAMEGGRECTAKANYKEHVGMVRPTKVSMVEIEGKKTKRKRKSPLIPCEIVALPFSNQIRVHKDFEPMV